MRGGRQLQIAVVAVGHEAGREVAREGELFGNPGGAGGDGPALLIGSEVPDRRAQADLQPFGGLGDDVDRRRRPRRSRRAWSRSRASLPRVRSASSGTGMSMLWWPDWTSLRRWPLSSTRVSPKFEPRIERSACTPSGARSSRSSEGSSRSRSRSVLNTRALPRAGSTRMARSISSSDMGSKVPVTTTVSCGGGCWAAAVKGRKRARGRISDRNPDSNPAGPGAYSAAPVSLGWACPLSQARTCGMAESAAASPACSIWGPQANPSHSMARTSGAITRSLWRRQLSSVRVCMI